MKPRVVRGGCSCSLCSGIGGVLAYARYFSEKGAKDYESKYRRGILRRLSAWREKVCVRKALKAVKSAGRVLDLPCGAGRMTKTVSRRCAFYVGADISPAMVFLCANVIDRRGGDKVVMVADAARVPAKDLAYDGVVAVRLLHHYADDAIRAAALAEFCRVASRFVVATFLDKDSSKQRKRLKRASTGGRPARRACVSRAQIAADLAAAGFEVAGFWAVSSMFSGQTIVAAVRNDKRMNPSTSMPCEAPSGKAR